MQGEMTPNGECYECIINDRHMVVHKRGDHYAGIDECGEYWRLTEQQVIEGVQAKMAADVEAYNRHAPQAAVSQGSYYGD